MDKKFHVFSHSDADHWNLFQSVHRYVRPALYCSISSQSRVMRLSLLGNQNRTEIIAGAAGVGSTAYKLNRPRGTFVDLNITLYVADCGNDRVQMFPSGQTMGITVAGNGSSGTIDLRCPVAVVVDGSGYLFIADASNHRIRAQRIPMYHRLWRWSGCSGVSSNNPFR